MGNIDKVIKRFRLFTFMYWAMVLSVTGMYTMYIRQLGFSKEQISITVTIYTLASLVGQSFIGYIVDKFKRIKKIMFICIAMGLIVGVGIIFAKHILQIYALMFIWGFFITGTGSLSEAWCMHALKAYNEQRNFGRVRGFGSIGYGISAAFLGLILQNFGWKVYSWYITAAIVVVLIIVSSMSDKYEIEDNEDEAEAIGKVSFSEALREIFKIKPLLAMIIIIFTYNFVLKGIYNYLGVLISDFGGGASSLGFTYFFDASPEIVTFFLTAKLLKRFHSKSLILVAFALQIVRLSVILLFNNANAVILMGILSGLAYGLLAASYKTYIYELAPAKYKASCLSLSESIIGLSGIISAPIFGFVFTKFGTNKAILFGLVLYILSGLILLRDVLRSRETINV